MFITYMATTKDQRSWLTLAETYFFVPSYWQFRHGSQIMAVDETNTKITSWANKGQATSSGECPIQPSMLPSQ